MREKAMKSERKEISNILESVDFELLPTEKGLELIKRIPGVSDVRLTCRPSGFEETICFLEKLEANERKKMIPHFAAARVRGHEQMDYLAKKVEELGISKVFLVRGDGENSSEDFRCTEDLIEGFCNKGVFFKKIDVAGHPEGNVFDPDPTDTLLRKQEVSEILGVEMEVVTQMCFDENRYLDWLLEIRKKGVYLPVRVGVLGKTKWENFLKTLVKLGVGDVVSFLKSKPGLAIKVSEYMIRGYSPESFLSTLAFKGGDGLGICGVSVFTLGSVTASVEEIARIRNG